MAKRGLVKKRFARMLKDGWAKAKEYFCTKFATSNTEVELIRKAREGIRADETVADRTDSTRGPKRLKRSDMSQTLPKAYNNVLDQSQELGGSGSG